MHYISETKICGSAYRRDLYSALSLLGPAWCGTATLSSHLSVGEAQPGTHWVPGDLPAPLPVVEGTRFSSLSCLPCLGVSWLCSGLVGRSNPASAALKAVRQNEGTKIKRGCS